MRRANNILIAQNTSRIQPIGMRIQRITERRSMGRVPSVRLPVEANGRMEV